ncbi:hypothetical protein BMS3Bbin11_00113 [bacterium BMS3Bbin11]|nr:hypothetical protein BMS3Bbin11_00113 [bacterium BMS3Bbin11]
MRILIIGVDEPGHVARFLYEGGKRSGHDVAIINTTRANNGNFLARKMLWKFTHRPISIKSFSSEVASEAESFNPDLIVTTGQAPILDRDLRLLRDMSLVLINYSTDDPWNPAHRADWFLKGISTYHVIFTTRKANISEFKNAGCSHVRWLPFGYDPSSHYYENNSSEEWESDLAFVGGADHDRVPVIAELIKDGLGMSLWGGYWGRYKETRSVSRGFADTATLRKVISNTRCALTLVRRANRDGHAMRTYEVAAIGAPMLVEDTAEHREIFCTDQNLVRYFSTEREMLEGARWFIENTNLGNEMSVAVRNHILTGGNTYADRLQTMIDAVKVLHEN